MWPKITSEVKQTVSTLLDLSYSYSMIRRHLKKKNIDISLGMISKIRNELNVGLKKSEKTETRGRKSSLSKRQLLVLKNMTENPNPLTQSSMANKLGTNVGVIQYQINKILNKKLLKKPKCQALSPKSIGKRYRRSWPLYLRLRGQRWRKVVTSDEALFHLSGNNGQTKVQYISRGENRSALHAYSKVQFPKSIMVWLGISANGTTSVRFVTPGVKINSDFYINKILKPFITKDIPKLYPNKDYLFHQDSCPSHVSKKTLNFLRTNNIPFITPEQWMAYSPDAAPLDYCIWPYLKRRVNKRKVKTISGLKKVISEEVSKIPPKYHK